MRDLSHIDKTALRLLVKHSLDRIDFKFTEKTVIANAMPKGYHTLVGERRERELRAAAEEAGGSITLPTAQKITEDALNSIAVGHGDTLEDALFDLERALKAL